MMGQATGSLTLEQCLSGAGEESKNASTMKLEMLRSEHQQLAGAGDSAIIG